MTSQGPSGASADVLRQIIESAQEAFVSMDADGRIVEWNRRAEILFGWSRAEALGRSLAETIIPEAFRERHRAGLERFLATGEGPVIGARLQLTALRREGEEFPVEFTISAIDDGGTPRFSAFLQDVTARVRAEQALRAQAAVSRILADAPTVDEALPALIEAIARALNWRAGSVWRPDADGRVLRCAALWMVEGTPGEALEELSWRVEFPPGLGIPGKVWQARQPLWVADLAAETSAPRAGAAAAAGLHAVLGFPVFDGEGRVVAVMDFLNDQPLRPDPELLAAVATIGAQVGEFLRRQQSEAALSAQRERLAAIVASSEDAIIATTLDGRITDWNPAAERLFGYTPDEVAGRPGAFLLAPERLDEGTEVLREVAAGRSVAERETQMVASGGRLVDVAVTASPLREGPGELTGVSLVVRDIGARRRAESELRRRLEDLEQFAYVASHDLAEPLRTMSGFADLLLRRFGDSLDPAAREYLDFILSGAARMRRLLDGLNDYAKAGGGLEIKSLDCSAVVARTVSSLASQIEATGATVSVGPLPVVETDEVAFERVVQNLIQNALKFTPPGEPPRVEITAERGRGSWTFSVADRGIGIAEAHRERVFTIFQRLHAGDLYAGTGLGLAICRKLVEQQGGRIWVDATPGGGSTFRFTVPDRTVR